MWQLGANFCAIGDLCNDSPDKISGLHRLGQFDGVDVTIISIPHLTLVTEAKFKKMLCFWLLLSPS